MNNDRGRGGTGPRKPEKTVERYGISPQMAPPNNTAMSKKCLNSDVVSRVQVADSKRMK
ncbi:MAG: hypothetical protein WC829_04530 [Hyphomicrobium sp.]